ncbi:hypothetical protein B0T22DRAFT_534800 [Podospora appendiculata]|uniref:SH3 domain-containing protein n=1 Tax=Podospora appendiculata TaxID=314037 RepID=A0AAE0X7P5_9PEZI|nr:hypothetical protein B0T22DRAFT_534800 [Podospora appendiculata]
MSFKVKAVFEYTSGHEDDLAFPIGQIITVTEDDDPDWYGGEYVDDNGATHEGIFPRNFVEKYEPTAPPRPTRTRTRREPEPAGSVAEAAAVPTPLSPDPDNEPVKPFSPSLAASSFPASPAPAPPTPAPAPASAPAPEAPAPKPVQAQRVLAPPPPPPQQAEAPSPAAAAPPPKPAPAQSKAAGPPPVSEKPSSFKDRIAAFNKAAAPPLAPFKPSSLGSGSSGFIKKPFVAPPPSRNAYISPPQQAPTAKVYRREEDPEIKEQEAETLDNAGKAGLVLGSSHEPEADEDQPKPLSLKERLALLQKQQMETAARHADAVAKKEKPKRPAKKRMDSQNVIEEGEAAAPAAPAPLPPLERRDTGELPVRSSLDESHPPRVSHSSRRKSSRGVEPNDGNEADMSGAGDTTEDPADLTERDDSDERSKHVATAAKQDDDDLDAEEDEEDEDEDPEARRKEELRARMAKMSGGMGMAGMPGIPLFGAPPPPLPKKKKAAPERSEEHEDPPLSPTTRPPVPTMMALPGMSRQQEPEPEPESDDEDEARLKTPHQETAPALSSREPGSAPPLPAGRPAPPPVPTDSRPPPPLPAASDIKSPSEGSVSDDELSELPDESDTPKNEIAHVARAPPPPPLAMPPQMPPQLPTTSPRVAQAGRSYMDDSSPISPTVPVPQNKRNSRMPPPIPAAAPAPPPVQTRPPPPPPPAAPPLGRPTTGAEDNDDEEEEEITEYEGDYDTDIASSVPHKDALKAHQRDSSFENVVSPRSPTSVAPPLPPTAAPRAGPPPIPNQPPPPFDPRKSTDMPRAAPPPPPPAKETPRYDNDEYDPFNYSASQSKPIVPPFSIPTSPPLDAPELPSFSPPQARAPPPAPPSGRAPTRQSLDIQRAGAGRRSVDVSRPSMESGHVAHDIDLASQSGWWLQPNSLPPQLQGRKDVFFEAEESSSANSRRGGKTTITRDIYVLFQDYSQTVITVRFDPQDASDVQLEQRHEAPPRTLRQDQLEQSYERFGRAIGEAVASKKDTVVGDGTPQALIYELLRPFKDALLPVGSRAYGALVYSNLANASTSQNDEIRPGDILSIRNAKFQGKHGPMHAKYSVEVGKPDHVAVVAEWDGTKKKVRAWEQGRESKKVKLESFKLDDLRSGEVKIWRVMPRSWIGWEGGS